MELRYVIKFNTPVNEKYKLNDSFFQLNENSSKSFNLLYAIKTIRGQPTCLIGWVRLFDGF